MIMDAHHRQAVMYLTLEMVDHEESSESISCCFTPCGVLEQTSGISESQLQCLDGGPLSEQHQINSQDKKIPKFTRSSPGTPREMRHADQVGRKENSRTKLLPKLDIMNTTMLRNTEPNGISAASWTDMSTKPVPPASPAPQSSLLSRSAPTIMEPFLGASSLLQVRTNIHNRLTNSKETDEWGQKGSPDSGKIRTPRTLAPLKRGCRNIPQVSFIRAPRPLKPIGLFPPSSDPSGKTEKAAREDREGSCASGRQGPLGREDTNRDNCDQESLVDYQDSCVFECAANPGQPSLYGESTGVMFEEGVCVISLFDKENCEFQHTDVNTETAQGDKDPQIDYADEAQAKQKVVCFENPSSEACRAEQSHSKSHSTTEDTPVYDVITENSHGVGVGTEPLLVPTVNVILSKDEHVVRLKIDRKGSTPFQTNNSFNVLACKNQSRKNPTVPFHVKCQDGKSDLVNKNMSKGIHTHTAQASTRKRVTESVKPRRGSADKKRLSNIRSQSQKQLNQKDQNRTKHLPNTEIVGQPKAKSAVDYVTYNDMFHEIMHGDNGPAIFEMFATPLYDKLRVARSSDRERQVQSAPPIKDQIQNFKNRCPKKVERKKKKQADKNKPKRNRETVATGQPCNVLSLKIDNTESFSNPNHASSTRKPEVISSVEVNEEIEATESEDQTQKAHVLSIIQEALSQSSSLAPMLGNQLQGKYLGTSAEKRKASTQLTGSNQEVHEEPEVKVDPNTECNQSPDFISSQEWSAQGKVNSWTSSTKERTRLPLFQTYGDKEEDEPLTDELMQCLVDELISLEEKEIETDHSENTRVDGHRKEAPLLTQQTFHKARGVVNMEGSYDDGAITWTKGEVLGRGAYGTVYCGLTSQGQLIAVKQVILDAMDKETADKEYGSLQREVDLLKSLHHTNIVGFLGTSLSESIISIFMEYVPGGSIASVLHRFGPLPERVFAIYTQQILEGVAYLHSNRIIHRDLKGNNIMLMPTGVVKLIDFGCARQLSHFNQTGSHGNLLKSAHGTPYWMAPEVINETGHGRKSDIWSVGCTVFEMATGKPPLTHMDKMAALFYIGARQGLMPSLPDNFSKHAKHFVQACLTSDQHLRPSAEQLLEHPFIMHGRWFD
ncbi:mitogen-activated protein kinase kinase kinase 19 [Alosa alosa]|uniref:mitogen-activated protein kinase kinase kinase 19 n=1 Tax=Alosa alosa TaxID=278164 RepID=UPI00201519E2|nr:mitogen-activated protein kinase kinase kinase 19 [Alosa alosa]